MAVLEVRDRASGQRRSTPVVIATVEGKRYLVSMLGPGSDWVKKVEAAHGDAVLRQGRWRHEKITLKPVNPEFKPIVLTGADEGQLQVIAEFVEVLGGES